MSPVPSAIHDLVAQLIAIEKTRAAPTSARMNVASQLCDRMRIPLVRLAGQAGFHSLMARALTLAKARAAPWLDVQIQPDGSVSGLDGVDSNAGAEIAIQLLGLLVTFIGEPLTRQLVREVWPDAATSEADGPDGTKS
jgi:hypothetical protein